MMDQDPRRGMECMERGPVETPEATQPPLEYDPSELIPREAISEWFDGKQLELGQRLADRRGQSTKDLSEEAIDLHKGEISNTEGQLDFMGEIAQSLQNLPITEETIETASGAEYDPKKLIPRSVIVEWFAREHAALGDKLADLEAKPFPTPLATKEEIDKHQGEIFKLQGRLELLDDIARSLQNLKVTNE